MGSGATVAGLARGSPHQAFSAFGTAYIFLCPGFHDQTLAPVGSHCPSVVNNRFVGDVEIFYRNYQMYTLLYGVVCFYLQKNVLGPRSPPKEVFDWDQCVGCGVVDSGRNPTNLVLYTACRLPSLLPSSR